MNTTNKGKHKEGKSTHFDLVFILVLLRSRVQSVSNKILLHVLVYKIKKE